MRRPGNHAFERLARESTDREADVGAFRDRADEGLGHRHGESQA
jgi:hypothetical protein